MAIHYIPKEIKLGLPGMEDRILYGVRTVPSSKLSLEELSEHMANHNLPYSAGLIAGVLTDMVKCIHELVLDGHKVRLDGLALFYADCDCYQCDTEKEVTRDKIRRVTLNARPAGDFQKRYLVRAASTALSPTYVDNAEDAPAAGA